MPRAAQLALLFALISSHAFAADHPAQGLILSVDAPHRTLTVSCAEIPGYMAAMEMPLLVRDAQSLATLKPGAHRSISVWSSSTRKPTQTDIHPIVNFEARARRAPVRSPPSAAPSTPISSQSPSASSCPTSP